MKTGYPRSPFQGFRELCDPYPGRRSLPLALPWAILGRPFRAKPKSPNGLVVWFLAILGRPFRAKPKFGIADQWRRVAIKAMQAVCEYRHDQVDNDDKGLRDAIALVTT